MPSAHIAQLLQTIRNASSNTTDQGKLFEQICKEWLRDTRQYPEIDEVYLWHDWPNRDGNDRGIDLVAHTTDDQYYAIQCKDWQEGSTLPNGEISKFLSASGCTYAGVNFSQLILITTVELSSNAVKNVISYNTPVAVIRFDQLEDDEFDWERANANLLAGHAQLLAGAARARKTPRPHQIAAINDVVKGLQEHDRGKLIMACGTGKTFTALKIAEKIAPNGTVLYLVPSLMLLAQSLKEWTTQSEVRLAPIVICSDTQAHEQDDRRADVLTLKPKKKKTAKDSDELTFDALELTRPATTKPEVVVKRWQEICELKQRAPEKERMTVFFSTYQSLQTLIDAQNLGAEIDGQHYTSKIPQFDLVICDEAHRTTGAKTSGADESAFVKVHDNNLIHAAKRLYMTATPRVYSSAVQESAKQSDVLLCSMDNEQQYGPTLHHLPFGTAVDQGLLSDYKVIIFAVSDQESLVKTAHSRVMHAIAESGTTKAKFNNEDIPLDEVAQMIGCWRALAKNRAAGTVEHSDDFENDPEPMKRAVAFLGKIVDSKDFAEAFKIVADTIIEDANAQNTEQGQRHIDLEDSGELDFHAPDADAPQLDADYAEIESSEHAQSPLRLAVQHVDGTFNGKDRQERLKWLREDEPGVCHVLSNVRCLSEGVDVPTLDAAIFMAPRNSEVDVIQAVGRVMRKAEGKKCGYIILPIAITPDVDPVKALDNNQRYRVVWQTLNAIRAHDERFRIMINQMQVNEKPDRLDVFVPQPTTTGGNDKTAEHVQQRIQFGNNNLDNALFAKIVKRCGDRHYLDDWAKRVATLTATRLELIQERMQNPTPEQDAAINDLVFTLKEEVNPNLDRDDALDLLAQHLTSLPVFDTIFAQDSFARENPVAMRLQRVIDTFGATLTKEEKAEEERFKAEVRAQIEGIVSAEGKRAVIHKLYEQFFNVALPKTAEKLGVVYTPVEVVDYILHSVNYVLQKEFKRRISNPSVHILDPFTGTGSFISRLLQSGLIDRSDLKRKYAEELHANEIMLLAYYIASVNIEETFREVCAEQGIRLNDPAEARFNGIVMTDTFQTTEDHGKFDAIVTANGERRARQIKSPIEVIIGNPPYSAGQKSANDFNPNERYATLDKHVKDTYVAKTSTTNKNSLYDSYIKAFRWASDRLDKSQGGSGRGVIAFVSNGAFIDNLAMEGFRKCLAEEFSTIYVFNLRGNQRTSGDVSRREGGKIFGSGSRAPIAITILVKNPTATEKKIFYRDIGDYLTREQKLGILTACGSVEGTPWEEITPNEKGEWINQRGEAFFDFFGLGGKKERKADAVTFFLPFYGRGVATARDAWAYNFSRVNLSDNMSRTIEFYNTQVTSYKQACSTGGGCNDYTEYLNSDSTQISWNRSLLADFRRGKIFSGQVSSFIRQGTYRPFCKEFIFFHKMFNDMQYQVPKQFPTHNTPNLVICTPGVGSKEFSTIITDLIPDLGIESSSQCFPLYYYEPAERSDTLFGSSASGLAEIDGYTQRYAITDKILTLAQSRYGKEVTHEDVFFYVYGALHSQSYRERYANELKKELARLPLPEDSKIFWKCCKIGRELADLHVNYETGVSTIPQRDGTPHDLPAPYPLEVHMSKAQGLTDAELYRVETKMKLGEKKTKITSVDPTTGETSTVERRVKDGTLKYNKYIAFSGIPTEAFDYQVNGRSPIEWLVDRYYRRVDKASQIVDDPNLYSDDPRYVFNLVPRLVALSLRTLELINQVPDLE